MSEGKILSASEAARTQRAVEHFERTPQNKLPPIPRRRSRGGTCKPVVKLDYWPGANGLAPDSGDFDWPITYDGVDATVTVNWNDEPSDIEAAIETALSSLSAGDMDGKVSGGWIATGSILVAFPDNSLFASNGATSHTFENSSTALDGSVRVQVGCCT